MTTILEAFAGLDDALFSVVDRVDLPPRYERRRPIPTDLLDGRTGAWLRSRYAHDGALWNHQSIALEAISKGESVVVATDTASGKSLVFQAAAFSALDRDPNARFLVFYPQVALANDQLVHWRTAAAEAGFPDDLVGAIYGGVPVSERNAILLTSRIVVMTPDVCQAWLMRNISDAHARRFLSHLHSVFIDEAHVFEGVMGSNVALLMRRLAVARSMVRQLPKVEKLLVVAASATIANPAEHVQALFGSDVQIVGLDDDGSRSFEKQLVHIAAEDEMGQATAVLSALLDGSDAGTFVAFVDSRQGVERIARSLDHEGVRPYRSGYEQKDRESIEAALRKGELRGVVSTSALELGINIPHFTFGLNIGIPNSRKALRQRVGRVGRSERGAFAIIADRFALNRLGSTLEEYWRGSVEPSHLYLQNRFIQFANSRCLIEELEGLGKKSASLPDADWPIGFAGVYAIALPAAARPPEFDAINQLGRDEPHLNYPLRNVGEATFSLSDGGQRIGDISLQQAIREAYPGAVYLHMMRAYRVYEWKTTVFDSGIRVGRSGFPGPTKPISRTFVNAAVDGQGVLDGRYLRSETGFLTECQLQITERVEGYQERGQRKLYRDLRSRDPGMKTKMREFRTSGVVFQVREEWFRNAENKRRFAVALREIVQREYSIAPQDIDVAFTNIALLQGGRRVNAADCIALFDSTYGSLRLSEVAFIDRHSLVERLRRANELMPADEAPTSAEFLVKLDEWLGALAPAEVPVINAVESDGFLRVFRPGCIVARKGFNAGVPVETEIVAPLLMEGVNGPELCYSVKDVGSARAMILQQSAIVGLGDDCEEILWNPTTGEFADDESTTSLDAEAT